MMNETIIATTYAPVFIPTLNRAEHFIKLIESLEKCTWSEKTEVYVSLDYPPSEKYKDGHKQIDTFLSVKEKANSFKQLHVFRQTHNLGILGNLSFLKKYMYQYDRFIFSEDDNVFSPNFLVYINKGLEKYKDDPSVFSINGYTLPYEYKFGDNNYFKFNNDFSAWGYGVFKSKWEQLDTFCNSDGFRKSLSLANIIKFKQHGYNHLRDYLYYCFIGDTKKISRADVVISCYMIVNDFFVVCPKTSTVRNEGWDNSGNSAFNQLFSKEEFEKYSQRHMSQKIDEDIDFHFKGNPDNYFKYNNKLAVKESSSRVSAWKFYRLIMSICWSRICRLFNKV